MKPRARAVEEASSAGKPPAERHDVTTAERSPSDLHRARDALTLQRLAGNRAVSRSIAQRQYANVNTRTVERPADVQRDDAHDADDAAFEAELDEILGGLAERRPEVPSFEAITATGPTDYSRGEFEGRIQDLWTRQRLTFTDAARVTARRNDSGRNAPTPTQSPQLAPGGGARYARRAALGLFASDYQKGSDLPAVAALVRRGSPMMASMRAEFPSMTIRRDPTTSDMSSAIFDAILELWKQNENHQIAELVVYFSGHGVGGHMSGIDGTTLAPRDMANLAEIGQDLGVHLVFVLDSCRAGPLVSVAQTEALEDLGDSAAADPQRAAQVKFLNDLVIASYRKIWWPAMLIGNMVRKRSVPADKFVKFFEQYQLVVDGLDNLRDASSDDREIEVPGLDFSALRPLLEEARLHVLVGFGGNKRAVGELLAHLSTVFDVFNTSVNAAIEQLHNGAAAAPATSAQ